MKCRARSGTRLIVCAASLFCLTLVGLLPLQADAPSGQYQWQQALRLISGERMLADVIRLSSPEFNGRQAGTKHGLAGAAFIADQFTAAGLTLSSIPDQHMIGGTPTGLMTSPIKTTSIGPGPSLQLTLPGDSGFARLGAGYWPVLDSRSADVRGRIVFVGYGISDPAHGTDDYRGVDVRNAIVLFLRGKPGHYSTPVTHADKVRIAAEKGAAAYLTATGPILAPYEARRGMTGKPSAFYGLIPDSHDLPGAWISTELAERILTDGAGRHLRELQEGLNAKPAAQALDTGVAAQLKWEAGTEEGILANVLASIPAAPSEWAHETVILGAHRDHFGVQAGVLFPGADDNASGTAVLLEAARTITRSEWRPKRTVLFVSFDGEERGLLGSRLYVARAPIPLSHTKAMINVDHAGIGNGRLTVGVTGIEPDTALEAGRMAGLADKLDLFGFFPGGDHVPFHEAGIPTAAVVSGGVHPHFHQPTDTADTLNPEILEAAVRYVLELVKRLADGP